MKLLMVTIMNRLESLFRILFFLTALSTAMMLTVSVNAQQLISRIKDISTLDGVQNNPLIGYGLVGGLAGTGDGRRGFTAHTLNNVLAGMGINVIPQNDIETEIIPDNVAAVMVTANLPPFARPGQQLDVSVVSIGRAQSLEGGTLLSTPLKGADGRIHGLAQGPVSLGGGFSAAAGGGGGGGAAVSQSHPLVGKIPNGMIVEGEPVFHNVLQAGNTLRWVLTQPDFKTASNIQRRINSVAGDKVAFAEDAGAIRVQVGLNELNEIVIGDNAFDSLVDAIAFIEDMQVETDEEARIVINERTGTIVAGQDIRVRNAVIAHGPLRITIRTTPEVTPGGIGGGGATVTEQADVQAEADEKIAFIEGTTIGEVVTNLNALGYTPRDLISILQSMHAAGYIKAEIEMI